MEKNIPDAFLLPDRVRGLDQMRTGRLAQSQSQKPRNRRPNQHVPRVEEVAVAKFLEADQRLSRRNESRRCVDGQMLLELCG